MTDPALYFPPQASERLLPQVNGLWTQCGVSSTWTCYARATAGETATTKRGNRKGRAAIRADLMSMWRGTGDTSRPSFNQSHLPGMADGLWKGGPKPTKLNVPFGDAMKALDGNVISMALRLRQAPANSPLRKWTSADHQVTLHKTRANGDVLVEDPMAPQGTNPRVWVPRSHLRDAAVVNDPSWNPNGVIAWRYPLGGWTAAKLATVMLRAKVRTLTSRNTKLEARLVNKDATIADLRAQLEAGADPDCSNARAAAREQALVQAVDAVDALRAV